MNTDGVLRVGDGRGFIIEHRAFLSYGDFSDPPRRKLVVTASHCLPRPPKMPCFDSEDTTYGNLLAPLGEEPSVWADCLFFDPVSDLAILGEPDDQSLPEESDGYVALLDERAPFTIARPESGEGYMLSLDNDSWRPTPLKVHAGIWGTGLSTGATLAGQSGSPIVDASGRAVAVVSVGIGMESGHHPILKLALPAWLLETVEGMPQHL